MLLSFVQRASLKLQQTCVTGVFVLWLCDAETLLVCLYVSRPDRDEERLVQRREEIKQRAEER